MVVGARSNVRILGLKGDSMAVNRGCRCVSRVDPRGLGAIRDQKLESELGREAGLEHEHLQELLSIPAMTSQFAHSSSVTKILRRD